MLAIEAKMKHPEKYIGWFGILDIAAVIVYILWSHGLLEVWRRNKTILERQPAYEGTVRLPLMNFTAFL